MKTLGFSPAAENDIAAIWEYSADTWGPDRADRYTDDIRKICDALVTGKNRGAPVDVRIGYLKRQTGSHMLYFRDLGDVIVIVRVLHSAQDVQRHL